MRTDTERGDALTDAFLARRPRYREWLDLDRVRDATRPRMDGAARVDTPYPHLFVAPFLPDEFYDLLADAWPPLQYFAARRKGEKLDLVPRHDTGDADAGRFDLLPGCLQEVWTFFTQEVNRTLVGPWLATVFRPEIEARLDFLARMSRAGRLKFDLPGLEHTSGTANVGRLMIRGEGSRLKPHVDPSYYLVTALHYFPEPDQDDESYSTRLYQTTQPIPPDALIEDDTTQYFHHHGIAASEARCVPFAHNGFLAFANHASAGHGTAAPRRGHRRVFQYHLSLKDPRGPL